MVNKRTQRDMETLATQFCGNYREPVVQMDDVPESKNVTSNWPVYIAVLLGIATILLVVLAIGLKLNSSFEINNLNLQVVELRAQLTQCQNEKQKMKECEEEVKNLTEVKGRFLAMKEESNNSLAVAKHADDLLDLLSNHKLETKDKLVKCEDRLGEIDAEVHKLMRNITDVTIAHERCFTKLKYINDELIGYQESEPELRKNVNTLTSKNHELTKWYRQCSKRLKTCEKSYPLYSLLCSRKCFKIMWGPFELNCHPTFVM